MMFFKEILTFNRKIRSFSVLLLSLQLMFQSKIGKQTIWFSVRPC